MEAQQMVGATTSRRIVGSFSRYVEAQRAHSYLAGQKFPMEHVTIVAEDPHPLKAVASQTGRVQAAIDGAVSGAVTGLLLAFVFDLVGWMAPVASWFLIGIGGLVFGLIVGAIVGLIVRALTDAQHTTATATGFEADHYSLMVDDQDADLAGRLISRVW
jgi:hypothetical protein